MSHARLIVLLTALVLAGSAAAGALPTGGVVAAGTASFTGGANSLVVTQGSSHAVINWNSFSVGAGNTVQFVQPSSSSAVLNRVVANNPSLIYGSINANGQVFLVNPNGILVGPGGTIQAAGIFLSTGNIANADFLTGSTQFEAPPPASSIVIAGNLTAAEQLYIRASVLDVPGGVLTGQVITVENGSTPLSPALPANPGQLGPLIDLSGGGSVGGSLVLSGGNFGGISILPAAPGGTLTLGAGASAPSRPNPAVIGVASTGGLVDGAVTLRVSLVDASPIALR